MELVARYQWDLHMIPIGQYSLMYIIIWSPLDPLVLDVWSHTEEGDEYPPHTQISS